MAVTLLRWPDLCGVFCVLLTYVCVGYAEYACLSAVILPGYSGSGWWCYLHATLFSLDILFLLASHTRALLADPGRVPLPATAIDFSDIRSSATRNGAEQASEEWTVCNKCEAYRPPRAHHCRVCQRCIRRMDHHCPWINNCVGEQNQKYFIQFLFYTGVASVYALLLVLVKLVTSGKEQEKAEEEAENQASVAHTVVLLVESLLFGIFVVVILYDQESLTEFQDHWAKGSLDKLGKAQDQYRRSDTSHYLLNLTNTAAERGSRYTFAKQKLHETKIHVKFSKLMVPNVRTAVRNHPTATQ